MNPILLFLLPSIAAMTLLPFVKNRREASIVSAFFSSLSFLFALILVAKSYTQPLPLFFFHQWLFCDKLSAFFILLNTFISVTTSFYAISYLNNESRTALYYLIYRFYHTFFHILTFSMLIVILSNNIALMWVAMELATISSVVLVALYQTNEALEAAWKYLILCGVGIGLALLGTIILYFAAHHILPGEQGLLWTALIAHATVLPTKLLAVAFVFLFVGYGTKVGFFPLHSWLPDAYTESSAMVNCLSSGALLNIAFLIILRFKLILAHTVIASFASHLFLIFGCLSLLFAALSLLRQRKLNRLFAYSSIEHMGLMSIAFGIGTPLAYLAGLLHILMHTLSKTAVFFNIGSIIQRFHTQNISQLKGLTTTIPLTGWCFLLSCFAILGLPPFGLFFSELLLILATLQSHPWLLIPLMGGLIVAFLAIFSKIQNIAFAAHPTDHQSLNNTQQLNWPVILNLGLTVIAGFWIPTWLLQPVIQLLTQAAA